jgi:hypothetical protein
VTVSLSFWEARQIAGLFAFLSVMARNDSFGFVPGHDLFNFVSGHDFFDFVLGHEFLPHRVMALLQACRKLPQNECGL